MKYPFYILRDGQSAGNDGAGGVASTAGSDAGNPFAGPQGVPAEEPAAPVVTPQAPTAQAAQVQSPAATQTPPVATQQMPQSAPLTAQQIAEISAQTTSRVLDQQRQQAQVTAPRPQMTQAEYNQRFNVHQVDAAGFQAITGYAPERPEQVAALNTALQGIARQSLTMANALMDERMAAMEAKLGGEIAPVRSHYQAQFEKQLRDDFFAFAPELKDYGALVETVAGNIKATGQKFNSKEELFKFAADKVRTLLPASAFQSPQATPGQQPQQSQQPTTQRRMAPVSTGGQVSTTQSSAAKVGDAQTIFG